MTTRALLEQVYLAPGDDEVRRVYADALIEAGEPRGEFIALQLAGKSGAKLLGRHRKAWLGALAGAVTAKHEFERGFLVAATVRWKSPRHFAANRAHREWATVERISFSHPPLFPEAQRAWRFGVSDEMTALRELEGGHAVALRGRRLPRLESASLRFDDRAEFQALLAADFPALRRVEILDVDATANWLAGVKRLPWKELGVGFNRELGPWLEQARRLGFTLHGRHQRDEWRFDGRTGAFTGKQRPHLEAAQRASPRDAREGWGLEEAALVLRDARGAEVRRIETNRSATRALSANRRWALLVSERGSERVDVESGKSTRLGLKMNARRCAISDDGTRIAACNENVVEVWAEQARLWSKPALGAVLAMSADGTRVAFGANPPPGVAVAPTVPRARAKVFGALTGLTNLVFRDDGALEASAANKVERYVTTP